MTASLHTWVMALLATWLVARAALQSSPLHDVRMRTRDGVTLVAEIVRPSRRGRFPTLLVRTDLGRLQALADYAAWVARGYAVVAQDCRGRGGSGGAWTPFVNEGRDGFDAVEWTARQNWCDGHVGMVGRRYEATAARLAALERPPALRCLLSEDPLPDAVHGLPTEYGAFNLTAALAFDVPDLPPDSKGFARLPLSVVDRAVYGRTLPSYQRWLAEPPATSIGEVGVPSMWLASAGAGTLATTAAWESLRREDRRDAWLVLGRDAPGQEAQIRRFLEAFLKDRPNMIADVPKVRMYVTGAERWRELDGWPASDSAFETRFLAPGRLEREAGPAGAVVYRYDPRRDTRTELGVGIDRPPSPPAGSYALFVGEPFDSPTTVAGPFECRLFFKSGAKDTDLFATLLDTAPSGARTMIGRPGKLRASYADGPLTPGRIAAATLRPWDAAYELAAGHRLGLLVTSSLFPTYARNLGTGEPLRTARRSVVQRNAILTGSITPSRITFRRLP